MRKQCFPIETALAESQWLHWQSNGPRVIGSTLNVVDTGSVAVCLSVNLSIAAHSNHVDVSDVYLLSQSSCVVRLSVC